MNQTATHRTSVPAPATTGGLPLIPAPRELRGFPLGTVILRLGLLPEEPINTALAECDRAKRQLGRYLVEQGLLDEAALARALATQKGLPFLDADGLVPDPAALELLNAHTARTIGALPVGFEGEAPVVAIADPTNERVLEQVRAALAREVVFAVTAPDALAAALAAVYSSAPGEVVQHPASAALAQAHAPEVGSTVFRVALTLTTSERLDVAFVADAASAEKRRKSLIDQLKRGTWPLVGERAIRPEAVVSIDVIETQLA